MRMMKGYGIPSPSSSDGEYGSYGNDCYSGDCGQMSGFSASPVIVPYWGMSGLMASGAMSGAYSPLLTGRQMGGIYSPVPALNGFGGDLESKLSRSVAGDTTLVSNSTSPTSKSSTPWSPPAGSAWEATMNPKPMKQPAMGDGSDDLFAQLKLAKSAALKTHNEIAKISASKKCCNKVQTAYLEKLRAQLKLLIAKVKELEITIKAKQAQAKQDAASTPAQQEQAAKEVALTGQAKELAKDITAQAASELKTKEADAIATATAAGDTATAQQVVDTSLLATDIKVPAVTVYIPPPAPLPEKKSNAGLLLGGLYLAAKFLL